MQCNVCILGIKIVPVMKTIVSERQNQLPHLVNEMIVCVKKQTWILTFVCRLTNAANGTSRPNLRRYFSYSLDIHNALLNASQISL